MNHQSVCAVVLAGGRGARMGGVDKGLQHFRGRPLVEHAIQRLEIQAGGAPGLIAVNANRNLPEYEAFGTPAWPDATDEFAGPLAGFQTALEHIAALSSGTGQHFTYLLTTPCDSPLFPLDLLQRLWTGIREHNTDIAVALAPEVLANGQTALRAQPVFSLMRCSVQSSLQSYLDSGERKIDTWFQQHPLARVAFNLPQDDANAFANANTLDELHTLEQL
jgi:molybdopterin-guanine dinucleotide biosynthesis protein A